MSRRATSGMRAVQPTGRGPLNPRLIFKCAANMGGLRGLLAEVVRNGLFHGRAQSVSVEVRTSGRGAKPELIVTDDGIGMSEEGRRCFGERLGDTIADGTGSGGRLAAVTLCQAIEVITVPSDDAGFAHRLTIHLPSFIVGVCNGSWVAAWERVPRADTPFPANLPHGTMLAFRDFRASDADAPFDERRMRDTGRQVRLDELRRIVSIVLPPDLARCVVIGGERVRPPNIEGFPLWAMPPRDFPRIGTVSGDLRYADDTEGRWCTIGGTTSTVPIRMFLEDVREHQPDLADRIPTVLLDRRIIGFIRIGVLERYPTQSRERIDPAFFDTEAAAAVVEFLATVVGPAVETTRAEYQSRPATEATRASLARIAARMNHAQGVAPGIGAGSGPATPDPATLPLEVNRVTVRLEVHRSRAALDTAAFRVLNPLPGETFVWDDHGAGILAAMAGDMVEAHAIRTVGVHPIEVQSQQYAHRRRSLNVDVYAPEADRDEGFLLIPQRTTVVVGEAKRIAVRSEGASSGMHHWSAVRTRGRQERAADATLEVLSGGRHVVFRPTETGDYIVRATDDVNPLLVAACTIEVIAQARAPAPDPVPAPGGAGDGIGGAGTRRSPVTRDEILVSYDGDLFTLRGVPYLRRPWSVEPENRLILVSDAHPANSGTRTPEERDRHLLWCVAAAIVAYRIRTGVLMGDDVDGVVRVHDEVLRYAVGIASAATAAPTAPSAPRAPRGTAARSSSS